MSGSDEIVGEGGKPSPEPKMSLVNDKREVCPLHGWVGRRAFHQDRHDLCEAPEGSTPYTLDPEDELEESDDENDEEAPEPEDAEPPPDLTKVPEEEDDPEDLSAESADPPSNRTGTRRSGIPSKKTLAVRRITRLELATGRAELKELGADVPYDRPRTRADCAQVPRPCPFVGCKYSLYLDVTSTGSIVLNFPHLEPGEMPPERSCALDLAESGPLTLEYIAVVTNLTRERIRQVELKALTRQGRAAAEALGLGPEGPLPKKP